MPLHDGFKLTHYGHLAGELEAAGAGADALDEPESPLLAGFDSVLLSAPVFFSAGADSFAEPLSAELELFEDPLLPA